MVERSGKIRGTQWENPHNPHWVARIDGALTRWPSREICQVPNRGDKDKGVLLRLSFDEGFHCALAGRY